MATRLYVGNLPFKASEDDLLALFQQAGSVQTVSIVRDKFSGRSRGFAFVEMVNDDDAQKAIESLNGHQMDRRELVVNEARPIVPRPPRENRPRRMGGDDRG